MSQFGKHSRRQFVKGALGAAVAAPAIVPCSVLGGETRAAPSERITIGLIGVGKMANDYHIPQLLNQPDTQVLGVCDVDTTRRNHAKKRVDDYYASNGGPKDCPGYNDFREVIGRRDIDAVCIAAPDHWHAIPLVEACKAGKDVYCEKPMTLTILEARRCIDAVRKHKRVFQTGSQQRSNIFGPFRQAVEIVRSGRLGKIKTVSPSRPDLNRKSWKSSPGCGPTGLAIRRPAAC